MLDLILEKMPYVAVLFCKLICTILTLHPVSLFLSVALIDSLTCFCAFYTFSRAPFSVLRSSAPSTSSPVFFCVCIEHETKMKMIDKELNEKKETAIQNKKHQINWFNIPFFCLLPLTRKFGSNQNELKKIFHPFLPAFFVDDIVCACANHLNLYPILCSTLGLRLFREKAIVSDQLLDLRGFLSIKFNCISLCFF